MQPSCPSEDHCISVLLQPELLFLIFSILLLHHIPSDGWNPLGVLPLVCTAWNTVYKAPLLSTIAVQSPGLALLRLSRMPRVTEEHQALVARCLTLSKITTVHLAKLASLCDHPVSLRLIFNRVRQDFAEDPLAKDTFVSAILSYERAVREHDGQLSRFGEHYRAPWLTSLCWYLSGHFYVPMDLQNASGLSNAFDLFLRTRNGLEQSEMHPDSIAKLAMLQDAHSRLLGSTIMDYIIDCLRCAIRDQGHAGIPGLLRSLDRYRLSNGIPLGAYCIFFPLVYSFVAETPALPDFLMHCGYDLGQAIRIIEANEEPTSLQLELLPVFKHLDALMKGHNPAQYNLVSVLALPGVLHAAECNHIFKRWYFNVISFRINIEIASANSPPAHASALRSWFHRVYSFRNWTLRFLEP